MKWKIRKVEGIEVFLSFFVVFLKKILQLVLIVHVLQMESFSLVHSVPLSQAGSLWPHPNHCLII